MRGIILGVSLLVLGLASGTAAAATTLPAEARDVRFDQRLGERVPLDLPFHDEAGRDVRLGQYFAAKKPVVLVLVYYGCPQLCTQVLTGLTEGLRKLPFTPGKDYEVVAVSFDAREDAPGMRGLVRTKKDHYVEFFGRPETADGWHFLTGSQSSIDELTRAVGFRYHFDAEHDRFNHASGITIVTPDGKLSRYLFGIDYLTGNRLRDLRLGIVDSSAGAVGTVADQFMLLCMDYNTTTGRYTAAAMKLVRAGSLLTLLSLLGFFVWAFLRPPATAKLATAAAGPALPDSLIKVG